MTGVDNSAGARVLPFLQSLNRLGIFFFFFNDTATPEISPLSLHDALPISSRSVAVRMRLMPLPGAFQNFLETRVLRSPSKYRGGTLDRRDQRRRITRPARALDHWNGSADRKSTRLNSSHLVISYAVFCLKK